MCKRRGRFDPICFCFVLFCCLPGKGTLIIGKGVRLCLHLDSFPSPCYQASRSHVAKHSIFSPNPLEKVSLPSEWLPLPFLSCQSFLPTFLNSASLVFTLEDQSHCDLGAAGHKSNGAGGSWELCLLIIRTYMHSWPSPSPESIPIAKDGFGEADMNSARGSLTHPSFPFTQRW